MSPLPSMIRRHGVLLRSLLMAVDGAVAAALLVTFLDLHLAPAEPVRWLPYPMVAVVPLFAVAWVALLYLHGGYRLRAHWTVAGEAKGIARAIFWLTVLGFGALLLAGVDAAGRGSIVLLVPTLALATMVVRLTLRGVFMVFRRRGHNTRNLVILGTGSSASDFARLLHEHSMLGVRVVGYLGDEAPVGVPADQFLGPYEELPRILRDEVVDEVAVCVDPTDWRFVEEYVRLSHAEGKLVRVPLTVPRLETSRRFIEDLDGTAVLSFSSGPDELAAHALKRAFDLVVAITMLVVLSPLLVTIAIALRLAQGPGILFRQTRVGIHGRTFTILKFRTMSLDAEARFDALAARSNTRGAAFKMLDDPRVTPIGRMLRRYSVDELPQLINVLRGEMSIVGPRPAPPREVEAYDLWHRRRLSMKPGITGLWQVTQRFDDHFDERAALDIRYIDRWSIWLDLAILFWTLPAIFRRPGH